MSNGLNRFLHGTLWKWDSGELALIISSDEYNSQNADVNCVSVVGVSDNSIGIENIQCNQIHTVEKSALFEFMGAVPTHVLAAVKSKVQKQFNMGDDKSMQAIQETAALLVGQLARMDSEYAPPATTPTVSKPHPLNAIVDMAADASVGNIAPDVILFDPSKNNTKPLPDKKLTRKPRGKKLKQASEVGSHTGKPKHEIRRSYTDEDEAFILDGSPTSKEIMERFGLADKSKIYGIKFHLKNRRAKRESK